MAMQISPFMLIQFTLQLFYPTRKDSPISAGDVTFTPTRSPIAIATKSEEGTMARPLFSDRLGNRGRSRCTVALHDCVFVAIDLPH